MKKRLEADLISIAHRILKIKNKSDINQLHLETQKLYEKLSVLRFVEEHYGEVKPTIGIANIEKEIEEFYDNDTDLPIETVIEITESNPVQEAAIEKEVVVTNADEEIVAAESTEEENNDIEEINEEKATVAEAFEADITEQQIDPVETLEQNSFSEDIEEENEDLEKIFEDDTDEEIDAVELSNEDSLIAEEEVEDIENKVEIPEEDTNTDKFKTSFEFSDEPKIATIAKPEAVQISFEDLLGGNYNDTLFVKVDDVESTPASLVFDVVKEEDPIVDTNTNNQTKTKTEEKEAKIVSLNDKLSKGIDIDLNDRIAFVKHLFGNNSEDYNRVLNQLITFDNFYETRNFIEEMVKPDYDNWEGKEDYADRFMEIIEKKFL
jgi:hypothetical protein